MNLMTLFQKIIDREIPADIVYEDDLSIVIKDINPQAPTHLLIIPKKPIPKVSDALKEDKDILGHLMWVAGEVARQVGVEDTFRLVVNNGAKAGQSVFHIHIHLLSGRTLSWPPG
ncbi:histidine triad nucleotide-binding protein [Gammaproteobacteria bacterium]|nr:histidine triad nucleotide-binding protein [Gammaproteobacteria bacterium]MDA9094432.1 histidine triad nucleotide-binding protein [Gammaproteobacteria bacterium]MDA9112196.1 histidine triad nucleotide-binding protein [Gammaproteobacteria bacterium]MDB9997559.1 histidine triad nucleotide-binding protein [Gammaproteobacteria bacterium]MDC1190748.1 histidine triad nucleotide-binding protein [Gammaproteobacteria bacterium]